MSHLPATIDRYQVRDRLGQGGMGVLYLAHDPDLERLVAIKLLRVGSDDLRERFIRESRIAARLQHPHIVSIYDVGEHDGQPFIAMEYIPGETLADLIARRAPLSLGRKLGLIEDLCEGLAFAHRAGVVHRDVKPANLMVNQEGVLKILDFGIARVADSGLTQVGVLMGTPSYMSPEQVDGLPVDYRSDVFAVGLVLYELLVYQAAFAAKSQHQTLHRILHDEPSALASIDPSLDPELSSIVARALRKRPEDRYQDLTQLRTDLSRLRQRLVHPSRYDETIAPPPASPDGRPAGTPRRGLDLSSLMRRRAEQLALRLDAAEQALARADLDAALAACEEAALLDPDQPRTVAVIDRVRQAIEDRQVREFLAAARQELDRDGLTGARDLVGQALQMRPDSEEAGSLQQVIDARFEAVEREGQRQQQVDTAVARARAALRVFAYELAARSAAEALTFAPGHEDAEHLRRLALEGVEAQRREEADETARALVRDARRQVDEGHLDAAISSLERAGDDHHPLVADALVELRATQAAIAARLADERWVAAHVGEAREALAAGQFDAARRALDAAATRATELPESADAVAEAGREVDAAEEAMARAQTIEAHLASARGALAAEQWDRASTEVQQALELDATHVVAAGVRADIEQARAAADDRRRQEALDRRASKAIEEAQEAFGRGRHDEALAALQRFDPPHPAVAEAFEALTAARAALQADEARQRAEAEARERAVAEARAREADEARQRAEAAAREHADAAARARALEEAKGRELAAALSRVDEHLSRREFDQAAARLAEAEHRFGPSPALTLLKARREALLHPDADADPEATMALPGDVEGRRPAPLAPPTKTPAPHEPAVPLARSSAPPVVGVPVPAPRRGLPPFAVAAGVVVIVGLALVVAWLLRNPQEPAGEAASPEATEAARVEEAARADVEHAAVPVPAPPQSPPEEPAPAEVRPMPEDTEPRSEQPAPTPRRQEPMSASAPAPPPVVPIAPRRGEGLSAQPPAQTSVPGSATPASARVEPIPSPAPPRRVEPTPAPVADPPRADPPATVDEAPAIRAAIGRWRAAYENLSVEQMAAAWVSLSPAQSEQFRTAFDACRSYSVTVQDESLDVGPDGQTAAMSARVRYECVTRAGGRRVPTTSELVLSLQKTGGTWKVARINTR